MSYKKILYPTDGSNHAEKALEHVVKIAKAFEAKVFVLSCYTLPLSLENSHNLPDDILNNVLGALKQDREDALLKVRRHLKEEDIESSTHIMEGNPKTTICEFARQSQCDMVILGSRGLGHSKNTTTFPSGVLGSISAYVIHNTDDIPVVVVD